MIWCVEDDPSIRELETYVLNTTGLEACGFEDGQIFWETLQEKQPDLVILDVMLPGIDGVELLTRIKASEKFRDIPVIMATAKGTEYDKVQSLDLGADDYLVKPFDVVELIARVEVVLRRFHKTQKVLQAGDVLVDTEARKVMKAGKTIVLTNKEYGLLLLFIRNKNVALFKETLYEKVWGDEYIADSRTLELHVQRLRKKMSWEQNLVAVYKVGYRLEI